VKSKQIVGLVQMSALALGLTAAAGPAVRADVALDGIKMTYHGGRLLQHVKVVPLLFGSSWVRRSTPTYLKNFFNALFSDGRYMANLAQFSAGGYQIGNGSAVDPVVDLAVLGKADANHAYPGIRYQVSDDEIQAELKAQITAGKLPKPEADTLYVVCFQYDVIITFGNGASGIDFAAYHTYDNDIAAPYAVISTSGINPAFVANTPTGFRDSLFNREMTASISHEMAEAVTDAEASLSGATGWYADGLGTGDEIGDIPATLGGLGYITDDQVFDIVTGADGTNYAVQKIWSVKDKAPVAFATATSP
jgi:hypothetical protein